MFASVLALVTRCMRSELHAWLCICFLVYVASQFAQCVTLLGVVVFVSNQDEFVC